jgi:polygalacturonase
MVNQPAGWSYWIHDCDYVSFDKCKIDAEVEYPNNDGIHVNSSRNVTISNCSIRCGDDCIIVRANNVSLPENKVCERVVVTNCNLTSYSGGIRIGWINDGVIRNCTFSNIVMTNTTVGIDILLPHFLFDPEKLFTADMGRESTLIENLTFNNIIMDNNFAYPIKILIDERPETKVEAIRNIYFSNIHASSPCGFCLLGREENPLDNIRLSDCTFEVIDFSAFNNKDHHGAWNKKDLPGPYPTFRHCDRVVMNNVEFRKG